MHKPNTFNLLNFIIICTISSSSCGSYTVPEKVNACSEAMGIKFLTHHIKRTEPNTTLLQDTFNINITFSVVYFFFITDVHLQIFQVFDVHIYILVCPCICY